MRIFPSRYAICLVIKEEKILRHFTAQLRIITVSAYIGYFSKVKAIYIFIDTERESNRANTQMWVKDIILIIIIEHTTEIDLMLLIRKHVFRGVTNHIVL